MSDEIPRYGSPGNITPPPTLHPIRYNGYEFINTFGLDWETWAYIMSSRNELSHYDFGMENRLLRLNPVFEPSQNLIDNFHLIKRARIEVDSSEFFRYRTHKYSKLSTLIDLTIIKITYKIDFITSRDLESLYVSPPIDDLNNSPRIDHVEPLLAISTKLRCFQYAFGILGNKSLKHLRNNPIELFDLQNVAITNKKLFIEFLCNTPTLNQISLQGIQTKNAQIFFFSEENTTKNQITHLALTLKTRLRNIYSKITEFPNLETLLITYESSHLLETLLPLLLQLNNLRRVALNMEPLRNDPYWRSEHALTSHYIYQYANAFAQKNCILNHFNEQYTETHNFTYQ